MDYTALIQLAIGMFGEQQAKNMSLKQLKLLERQLNDVRGVELPDLPELKAEELGDSAVAGMQSDQELRAKQLRALATLTNIIDQGGLDLSDRAGLEEAMGAANNQQRRARASVAGDAASRGQLNSGARLMMDLDAAQAGSNNARKTGMETAAMAQRRKLEAIREASGMSGAMREQDWRENEASARAKDLRDERNAAAREKAQIYNAGLPQQGFNNALAKATGQLPSTSAVGNALGAAAVDARMSAGGMAGVVGAAGGAYGGVNRNAAAQKGADTYNYDADSNNFAGRGSASDISDPEDK